MAQHGVDMAGDRAAVLDAGKAVTAEIAGRDIVGRAVPSSIAVRMSIAAATCAPGVIACSFRRTAAPEV